MAAPCGASGSVMGSLSPSTSAITAVSDLGKKLQDLAATASQINGTEPAKLTKDAIKHGLSQAQQIDAALLSENTGMCVCEATSPPARRRLRRRTSTNNTAASPRDGDGDIGLFENKFLRHMLSSIPIQIVVSGAASGAEIGRATVRLPISDVVFCSTDVSAGNSLTTLAEQHCIRPSRDAMIGEWRAMISAHLKDIFPEACEYEMSAFGSSVLGQGSVMLDEFDGGGVPVGRRRCLGAPKPGEFLLLMADTAIRLPSGIENDPRAVRRQLPESHSGVVVVDIVFRIGAPAESPSLGVVFKEFHGREIFGFGVLEILDGATVRFKGSEVLVWARRGNDFAELPRERRSRGPTDRGGLGGGYAPPRQSPAEEPVFLFVFDSEWVDLLPSPLYAAEKNDYAESQRLPKWNLADAIGQDILTRMAGLTLDWKAALFKRCPEFEDIFGILTTTSTDGHESFLGYYLDRPDPTAAKEIYEEDTLGDVWEEITTGDHAGEDGREGSSSVEQTVSERDGIKACGIFSDDKLHGKVHPNSSSAPSHAVCRPKGQQALTVSLCVARVSDPVASSSEERELKRRHRG